MLAQSLLHTYRRYRTLQTHKITALPVVILMPHSACNCKCVMCDIWKGNSHLKQLTEEDVRALLSSLRKFGTREVVMSGGEALLNPAFFRLCEIVNKENIRITLLSTGLTLKRHSEQILRLVDNIIVSIDGNQVVHDMIRNIPGAFNKLRESVRHLKSLDPSYRITARTVIHRLNFKYWTSIIQTAKDMGIDQISFLPADVSSHAFNREVTWDDSRQHEILLDKEDLVELRDVLRQVLVQHKTAFDRHFIAESPEKLEKIYLYYAAFHGLNPFPYKRCNAPWVSTVIESDGTVRPCFFHPALGNIRESSLGNILNSKNAIDFRKSLDIDTNETCKKCVCYLNLSPRSPVK